MDSVDADHLDRLYLPLPSLIRPWQSPRLGISTNVRPLVVVVCFSAITGGMWKSMFNFTEWWSAHCSHWLCKTDTISANTVDNQMSHWRGWRRLKVAFLSFPPLFNNLKQYNAEVGKRTSLPFQFDPIFSSKDWSIDPVLLLVMVAATARWWWVSPIMVRAIS